MPTPKIPDTVHVLFEKGIVVGCFTDRQAAERMRDARMERFGSILYEYRSLIYRATGSPSGEASPSS